MISADNGSLLLLLLLFFRFARDGDRGTASAVFSKKKCALKKKGFSRALCCFVNGTPGAPDIIVNTYIVVGNLTTNRQLGFTRQYQSAAGWGARGIIIVIKRRARNNYPYNLRRIRPENRRTSSRGLDRVVVKLCRTAVALSRGKKKRFESTPRKYGSLKFPPHSIIHSTWHVV